jgi:hypothetical protein
MTGHRIQASAGGAPSACACTLSGIITTVRRLTYVCPIWSHMGRQEPDVTCAALLSLSPPPPSASSFCFLTFFPPSPFPKNVRCPMTGFRETLFYLPLAPRWFPSLVSQKSGPAFIMLFDFGVPLKITSLKRPMIIWNSVQPGPNFCFSPYLNDKQC